MPARWGEEGGNKNDECRMLNDEWAACGLASPVLFNEGIEISSIRLHNSRFAFFL
jgi:hypothetical protein